MKTSKLLITSLLAAATTSLSVPAFAEIDSFYGTLEWTTAPSTKGNFYGDNYGLTFNFTEELIKRLDADKSYVVAAYWGNTYSSSPDANAVVLNYSASSDAWTLQVGRGKMNSYTGTIDGDTTFTFFNSSDTNYVTFTQTISAGTTYTLSVTGGDQAMAPTLSWGTDNSETLSSYAGNMYGGDAATTMNSALLTLCGEYVWAGGATGNWTDASWTIGESTNQTLGNLSNVTFNSSVAMTATDAVSVHSITVSAGELSLSGTVPNSTTLAANAGTVNIGSGWALSSTAQIGGVVNIDDGGVWEVVGPGTSAASRIIGKVNINAGGTLRIAGHDALGYNTGGAMTDATIIAQGTEGNLAKIVIADGVGMTFSQKFQLKGYTEISGDPTVSGTNLNSYSGSVVATGTNNTISAEIKLRKAFTVEVSNQGDELLISGLLSDHSDGYSADVTKNLVKTGAGTLTLSGTNTFTGGVTISGGVLVAANASALGTLAAEKSVSVADDAALQIAAQNVSVGTTGAGVAFASGAKLVVDLADFADAFADVSATDSVLLRLLVSSELKYNVDTTAVTLSSATLDSFVSDYVTLLGTSPYESWAWSYDDASSALSLTVTVPEPSAFGLLAGAGALALVASRRRRRVRGA